jgi:hypothetical protein
MCEHDVVACVQPGPCQVWLSGVSHSLAPVLVPCVVVVGIGRGLLESWAKPLGTVQILLPIMAVVLGYSFSPVQQGFSPVTAKAAAGAAALTKDVFGEWVCEMCAECICSV